MLYGINHSMKLYIDRIKKISALVAVVQASIVLTVVYVIGVPFLWFAYMRKLQFQRVSGWVGWSIPAETMEDLSRQ